MGFFADLFLSRDEKEKREALALYERTRDAFDRSLLGRMRPERFGRNLAADIFKTAGREIASAADVALYDAIAKIIEEVVAHEKCFHFPDRPSQHSFSFADGFQLRKSMGTWRELIGKDKEIVPAWASYLRAAFVDVIEELPAFAPDDEATLEATVADLLHRPAIAMSSMIGRIIMGLQAHDLFMDIAERISINAHRASGIDNPETSRKPLLWPRDRDDLSPSELVETYFAGTPFKRLLSLPLPFRIPVPARFEHMHVVAGSGHGKTQLLQHLILNDLAQLRQGHGSLVVIDSQGDMLNAITRLAEFSPHADGSLFERLVLIDPNDVEHPPALNLFDFGLDRLDRYGPAEREKLVNGAIALYEYLFGSLLGAELTQRQGVIFRYLARLLMVVENPTIHTLRGFMEDPESVLPHLPKLDGNARQFFESQFLSKAFDDTRQQILTRLWGVLSNSVLARMFSNPRNKVNVFEAINQGSVILINTAKDLLKQDGCEILGRFFIALIAQAAQERAVIPADRRRATFVYIDEAQDYFDESIEHLLNQARKYKVGLILAHQNLDQFERGLLSAVMSSTSIKLAGGVSARDATAFSKEMRCDPELIQGMRKRKDHTEFACWIKNETARPIRLSVPFSELERRPKMESEEHAMLLAFNRERFCGSNSRLAEPGSTTVRKPPRQPPSGFEVGEHEML